MTGARRVQGQEVTGGRSTAARGKAGCGLLTYYFSLLRLLWSFFTPPRDPCAPSRSPHAVSRIDACSRRSRLSREIICLGRRRRVQIARNGWKSGGSSCAFLPSAIPNPPTADQRGARSQEGRLRGASGEDRFHPRRHAREDAHTARAAPTPLLGQTGVWRRAEPLPPARLELADAAFVARRHRHSASHLSRRATCSASRCGGTTQPMVSSPHA